MNFREKMRSGALYCDVGVEEGLPEERLRCRELVYEFNHSHPKEEKKRRELAAQIFGSVGKEPFIEPPLHCSYGVNTHIGDYFYANFGLTIVDDIELHIGSYVMLAPNVTISVTGHPVHPELRRGGPQFSFPVAIGDDVWVGAGAVILPGVTIGRGSVIGAGSVVTKDIPENVVAVGSPCRVIRKITEKDREYYYKDLRVK